MSSGDTESALHLSKVPRTVFASWAHSFPHFAHQDSSADTISEQKQVRPHDSFHALPAHSTSVLRRHLRDAGHSRLLQGAHQHATTVRQDSGGPHMVRLALYAQLHRALVVHIA